MALINTVLGPVDQSELGIVLPFERILEDAAGVTDRPSGEGCREMVRHWAAREFQDLLAHGARTVVDVTPPGGGRHLDLMRDLAQSSHLRVIAATGFGPVARRGEIVRRKTKHIAEFLVKELAEGMAGTEAKAGVVSLAVDGTAEEDPAIIQAVGAAHEKTGAPVVLDAGRRRAEVLDALEQAGVPPHCVAVAHASVPAAGELAPLAERGAMLLFTDWGIAERGRDEESAALIRQLQAAGALDRVLISVGFGFRIRDTESVEWPLYGVAHRTYAYLFRAVLPFLRQAGLTEGDLWQVTIANPAAFLAHGGEAEKECRFCAGHRH